MGDLTLYKVMLAQIYMPYGVVRPQWVNLKPVLLRIINTKFMLVKLLTPAMCGLIF